MRLLGPRLPRVISAREQAVHATLDKVQTETAEAARLNHAWWEVRRAEQVFASKRRTHE